MTIDERFEYLQRNIDSLHEAVFENTKQISELARRADAHEREMQRFRRAMRAALEAWLAEDGDGQQGNGEG
jgi:prefoldin subunit 5